MKFFFYLYHCWPCVVKVWKELILDKESQKGIKYLVQIKQHYQKKQTSKQTNQKKNYWCRNGSIILSINTLGLSCPPGLGAFFPFLLIQLLCLHIKTCTWWALRSNGCVRKCSPGGHPNKEWVGSVPFVEAQLSALLFLVREQNMALLSGFHPCKTVEF